MVEFRGVEGGDGDVDFEMNEDALKKHGVEKLSKSPTGRAYLNQLREKYKWDIIQPSDPLFKKIYSKVIAEKEAKRRENEGISAAMRERIVWEREQKAAQGTEWKRKKL